MAEGFYTVYTQLQSEFSQKKEAFEIAKKNGNASADELAFFSKLATPADEEQYVKDKLFINTGEDVEDIFLALKFHKLMWASPLILKVYVNKNEKFKKHFFS